MFDSVINFISTLFKKSTWLFYRERMILNVLYYKALTYFNFIKLEHVEHNTRLGKIKGLIENLENGGTYYSFRGIPYAAPPVGKLRFMSPQPAQSWTDVLDATNESKKCLQKDYMSGKQDGGEDCLYLNVYTKELPTDNKQLKPVMVYIHGGGFVTGANYKELYGPDYILEEDVVIVVIQYRLGLLGFLNLTDPKLGVTGNTAFKDMTLALKWVKLNISDYGGDPRNITIFGESAGSVSVHLLTLSPLTKGLFNRAIAQSGSSLNGWSHCTGNIGKRLANITGCDSDDEEAILLHLQDLSIDEIYKAQVEFDKVDRFSACARYVGWVIEPPGDNAFLTKSPMSIILSGDYNHVPIIMGFNSCEGMLFEGIVANHNKGKYWDFPEINVPCLLDMKEDLPETREIGEKILQFYLGERPYAPRTHYPLLHHLLTDNCFLWGIYQAVRNHSKTSTEPIYLYRLSVESQLNFYKHLHKIQVPGVSHADDLGYLFKSIFTLKIQPNSIEDISRRRICRLWANFAKYGNPTPEKDDFFKTKWLPVEENDVHFLDIGESLELDQNPEERRMKFWNEIYSLHPQTKKLL